MTNVTLKTPLHHLLAGRNCEVPTWPVFLGLNSALFRLLASFQPTLNLHPRAREIETSFWKGWLNQRYLRLVEPEDTKVG